MAGTVGERKAPVFRTSANLFIAEFFRAKYSRKIAKIKTETAITVGIIYHER